MEECDTMMATASFSLAVAVHDARAVMVELLAGGRLPV